MCDALVPVSLKKDEVLFNEGDDGNGMYFVEQGKVSVKQKSTKKKGEKEVGGATSNLRNIIKEQEKEYA